MTLCTTLPISTWKLWYADDGTGWEIVTEEMILPAFRKTIGTCFVVFISKGRGRRTYHNSCVIHPDSRETQKSIPKESDCAIRLMANLLKYQHKSYIE